MCCRRRKQEPNSPTYDNPDNIVAVRFSAAPSLPVRACNRNTGQSIPDEKHAYDDPDIQLNVRRPIQCRPRGSANTEDSTAQVSEIRYFKHFLLL